MVNLTRRQFVSTSLVGAGVAGTLPAYTRENAAQPTPSATDQVELGQTGIKASRLAMGTGFKGWLRTSIQTQLGQEAFDKLMKHGYENGINFFDSADMYGSHPLLGKVLKTLPRDKYVLLSKIWVKSSRKVKGAESAYEEFARFRKELGGVDHIDIILLHALTDPKWTTKYDTIRGELDEMKQKGMIRAHGCSCHSLEALKLAAEDPWVDVIFSRINPHQVRMDDTPEKVIPVLHRARANGKAVIGMKIFGAGKLLEDKQKDESLRFAVKNKVCDAMTIGFERNHHVDDTIERLNKAFKA